MITYGTVKISEDKSVFIGVRKSIGSSSKLWLSKCVSDSQELMGLDCDGTKMLIALFDTHHPFAVLNSRIKSGDISSLSFYCENGGNIFIRQNRASISISPDFVETFRFMLNSAIKLMTEIDGVSNDADTVF